MTTANYTIWVSGFTGSLGSEVTRKLLEAGHTVVGYSRDELKQSTSESHERLTKYLGCVRDKDRVVESTRGCDMILHLAALKQVDKLEENPEEAILTNTIGTMNVLHAQRVNKIRKVTLVSTDKAVKPINVYGASKLLAERLVLRDKRNCVVRYGNVLASRGSVIPKFIEQIRHGRPILVCNPEHTRFWITLDAASDFVIDSLMRISGLSIPYMKSAHVVSVADRVSYICKGPNSLHYVVVGDRPGEKIHEDLTGPWEGNASLSSENAITWHKDDLEKILEPICQKFL